MAKVINDTEDIFRTFDFSEKTVRHSFIRKVFLILIGQLCITAAFVAWFLYHEPTKQYVLETPTIFLSCLITTTILVVVLAFNSELRRATPYNYICLLVFTLVKSCTVATIASVYDVDSVLFAVGITIVVCIALTIFAFQTRWDFTMLGGALFAMLVILIGYGLIVLFLQSWYLELAYSAIGALIFSLYLVYDIQLMIGGGHKYTISPEEYIFAALNLYIDIANLFIFILTLRSR